MEIGSARSPAHIPKLGEGKPVKRMTELQMRRNKWSEAVKKVRGKGFALERSTNITLFMSRADEVQHRLIGNWPEDRGSVPDCFDFLIEGHRLQNMEAEGLGLREAKEVIIVFLMNSGEGNSLRSSRIPRMC